MKIYEMQRFVVTFNNDHDATKYVFDSKADLMAAQFISIGGMSNHAGTTHKVRAIKTVRTMFGWGLREAKEWVELYHAHSIMDTTVPGDTTTESPFIKARTIDEILKAERSGDLADLMVDLEEDRG